MLSTSKEDYLEFSHKVVEYLKTRHHTEAPHISLLSPEYSILPRLYERRGTLLEFINEEDIDDELVEILDPTRIRGHSTFGVKATFANYNNHSRVKFQAQFYIRTAPGSNFKRIHLSAEVIGENKLYVSMDVFSEDGSSLIYSSPKVEASIDKVKSVIIGFGTEEIAKSATELIKRALYPRSTSLYTISDRDTENALGTDISSENEFRFLPCNRKGRYKDCYSSKNYLAVQNFLLEFSKQKVGDNVQLSFVLRYIGPALLEADSRKLVKLEGRYGIPNYVYYPNSRGSRLNRWAVSHLFEVEGQLSWTGLNKTWSWIKTNVDKREFAGLYNLEPIGCLSIDDKENENRVLLRDWQIEVEEVYPVESASESLDNSFRKIYERISRELNRNIDTDILWEAFQIVQSGLRLTYPGILHLRKFQEESLYKGLKSLLREDSRAIVLEARTAGGKTLSFLLPLLIYSTYKKLKGEDEGTKALLIYPTTALQNDQATTLFKLLWNINIKLMEKYRKNIPLLSLGLLYGLTPSRAYGGDTVSELRLPCPICGSRLQLKFKVEKTEAGREFRRESIVCPSKSCKLHKSDSEEYSMLQKMIRATREAIYSNPPDFIIANPDILNARLTISGREDPAALSILGKSVYICENCGAVHDKKRKPRKCKICGSQKLEKKKFGYPKVIVVDEAHLFRGAFGAQVSHLLTRLEQAIRSLNGLPEKWRPVYFISSATLNNPKGRASELVNIPQEKILLISASPDKTSQSTNRVHVFIMPKRYSPEATVSRILEAVYRDASALHPSIREKYNSELEALRKKLFSSKKTGKPTTLVFVNRISEANDLLNYAKFYLKDTDVRMDGHTTDYQRDRVRVEDEFSKGNLDLVIATSGLEVGVNFDLVDVGVLYGMPFYIADYTQRIGRIGRKQHSIVFNIFMPDKPVDYFYYKNWKLMCDGYLRDVHIMNEAYVINRSNPHVVRKAAKAAVLDMLSTHPGAETELETPVPGAGFNEHVEALKSSLISEAKSYVPLALGIKGDARSEKIALKSAEELINMITRGLPSASRIRKVIRDSRADLSFIRSLRDVEEQTLYDFNFPSWLSKAGKRQRSIQYSFRHCVPGQIISYRGFYFVISTTEAVDITWEED